MAAVASAPATLSPPAPLPAPCVPLLKWVGGKQRLLPELVRRLPPTFGRYYEPFAGGAALAFHLARPGAVVADLNDDLIFTYRVVAEQPEWVIAQLRFLEELHAQNPEVVYRDRRTTWNSDSTATHWASPMRAATMIYLNRTCYNGLWRTNRAGAMNAPMGRYAKPTICDPARIRAAAAVLASCRLWATDYATSTCDARAGDLVYFDPPYAPASPTANFTAYTAGGFGADDHRALAGLAARLVERGVYVMLSNADTPFVRQLYRDRVRWKIHRVKVTRPVNCRGSKRGPVSELIITNYAAPRRRPA